MHAIERLNTTRCPTIRTLQASGARGIDYLRLSVTDRCALECAYCNSGPLLDERNLLSAEEIARIADVAVQAGVRHIRLTGGEPLERGDLIEIIERLASLPLDDLSMTTNGVALARDAERLRRAGLRRVNVSLCALDRSIWQRMTGADCLADVLEGIRVARDVGLNPVKINTVVMRGINDSEILPLARFAQREAIAVRFIEYMASGNAAESQLVTADEILSHLSVLGPKPVSSAAGAGPAEYYGTEGGGLVGIIAPVTRPFCGRCNRLRVTAEGKLRACLIEPQEIDLRPLLQHRDRDTLISDALRRAASQKPAQYRGRRSAPMRHIGG